MRLSIKEIRELEGEFIPQVNDIHILLDNWTKERIDTLKRMAIGSEVRRNYEDRLISKLKEIKEYMEKVLC